MSENIRTIAGFDFRKIITGDYQVGSNEDQSDPRQQPATSISLQHEVWLMVRPMTRFEWQSWGFRDMSRHGGDFEGGLHPVDSVSWNDSQDLISKVNLSLNDGFVRLPSEAEWEIACRANSDSIWWYGDDASSLSDYAWFSQNSGTKSHIVGTKKPNPWGFYDLLGNVREWCEDVWIDNHSDRPKNGFPLSGDSIKRPLRGGAWLCESISCTCASRVGLPSSHRSDAVGLRLAWLPN